MRLSKKINYLLICAFSCAFLWAQQDLGKSSLNPIKFNDVRYWIDDERPSIKLLEQTLRTDMLGVRSQLKVASEPRWVKVQNQLSKEMLLYHFTFQGIFWAPIFSAIVWTPPAALFDYTMNLSSEDWEYFFTAAVWSTVFATTSAHEQNTFSELVKLNVVFVSDNLGLDDYNNPEFFDSSLYLSRTYAGLAIKVLETNYLFAGYSFVNIPYLDGWQNYILEQTQGQSGQVFIFKEDGFSKGELFFYNNFADLLSLSAIVDWGAEAIISFLGIGLYLNFFELLRPDFYFTYIKGLSRISLDTEGDLKLADWFYVHWKWYLPLNDWKPLNDLRVGATMMLANQNKDFGLGLRGDYLVYYKGDERKEGFFAELGLYFPASLRIVAGASLNAGDNVKRLPFAEDVYIYHLRLEIGMDNNFDSRLKLRQLDLMGFRVE